MINTKKTTQDILQEEILRERAAVLARAGERLAEALEKLHGIDREIAEMMTMTDRRRLEADKGGCVPEGDDGSRRLLSEINGKIHTYNRQHETVRTRYYNLIVTREALGLIHHQRLEEFYRIPPRKHPLE